MPRILGSEKASGTSSPVPPTVKVTAPPLRLRSVAMRVFSSLQVL